MPYLDLTKEQELIVQEWNGNPRATARLKAKNALINTGVAVDLAGKILEDADDRIVGVTFRDQPMNVTIEKLYHDGDIDWHFTGLDRADHDALEITDDEDADVQLQASTFGM